MERERQQPFVRGYGSGTTYDEDEKAGEPEDLAKTQHQVDARICQEVRQRLADDALLDASAVEVDVVAQEVSLSGTVVDTRARFQAEDLAAQVFAVRVVRNKLSTDKSVLRQLGEKLVPGAEDAGL